MNILIDRVDSTLIEIYLLDDVISLRTKAYSKIRNIIFEQLFTS